MLNQPVRVLICSPTEKLLGGIPTAVNNLLLGLLDCEDLRIYRFTYGRTSAKAGLLTRVIEECIAIPKYISILLRHRPHIVQIESSLDLKSLLRDTPYLVTAKVLRARILYRSHGGAFDLVARWPLVLKRWTNWLLRVPDRVILLASAITEQAVAAGVHPRQIIVIPNAISPCLTEHIPRLTKDTTLSLVFAGRLIPAKGCLVAVESMQYLRTFKCTLYVFGEGPDAATLKARVDELDLSDQVRLMGRVPEEELADFLRLKGDVFLFPSYHREGFPIALFTAVSAGLGIVSTRVRPVPDYLREPANCLWIPPASPRDLAAQITRFFQDPTLLAMQRPNNRSVGQQFHPQIIASRYRDLYHTILGTS